MRLHVIEQALRQCVTGCRGDVVVVSRELRTISLMPFTPMVEKMVAQRAEVTLVWGTDQASMCRWITCV